MRTRTKLYAAVLGLATTGAFVLSSGGASSHGYTDLPISRQKLCQNGTVANCGDIQWEPQSVEGPKASRRPARPTDNCVPGTTPGSPSSTARRPRTAGRGRPPR